MRTHEAISPDSELPWMDPGAWVVADGVWRIPLPLPNDGLTAVNVYALGTDRGLTLIDGGWAIEASREQLIRALRSVGFALRDIRSFLVTHVHRDHYTQAVVLRRELGAHVSLGLGEKPSLDRVMSRPDVSTDPRLDLLRECGASELAEEWLALTANSDRDLTCWESPDTWLAEDQEIPVGGRSLRAVHTPGHTQGHLVFRDAAAGLLFAGDHVLPTLTPSIGFEPVPAGRPLRDFMGSLAKVRALADTRLLPAHGPVTQSVHKRVDELVAHHDHRLTQCAAAVGDGDKTAQQTAQELPWTKRHHAYGDLDVFNAVLATLETRAHLELLVSQGSMLRIDGPQGVVYSRPGGIE